MKPKASLLIVDDNEIFLSVLAQALKLEDYQVTTVRSGEDAVEIAKAKKFQVILIDLVMPGQGGFKTIETLKNSQPDARVIAMTGGLDGRSDSFLRMAGKMGASWTLAKPFAREELLDAIEGKTGGFADAKG